VVLVPTLVPGCNIRSVGAILHRALQWYPAVRAVHFQPVSYFGRHPGVPTDRDRLTLPELMRIIETQTEGLFRTDHFRPPGCEHALCSFHAQYIVSEDGQPRPLHCAPMTCCSQAPIRAEEGAARAIAAVARQWAAAPAPPPEPCGCDERKLLGKDSGAISLDDFLATTRARTFSVSAMAFQDVWNLDLERVRQCCIHVMAEDGRLVPFCLYNLTSAGGCRLYRP
jgi:uncharacterized radical SAM superfamily Fe-S cluster-containing enzyme